MMTRNNLLFTSIIGLAAILLFLAAQRPMPASRTIYGTVSDENKDPLTGATVLIKGTSVGTITDFDGKYKINVPDGSNVLVFSYTGYQTQEVTIGDQNQIDVQMAAGDLLEEIVVIGLGAKERSRKKSKAPAGDMAARQAISGNTMGLTAKPSRPVNRTEQEFNTEDYALIQENRFHRPLKTQLSTFSIDVDAASYSNIRRFINDGAFPPKDAVRIEEMVNYFDYDYPQPQGYNPFTVTTELGPCPWQEKHLLLHIGLQGKQMPTAQLPASNLVFLLDVSGSMSDYNKLPLVKESLKMLVDNLRQEDKVAIVVYAGAAGEVLPATPGSDKQRIKDALEMLEAGGSTAGGAGIQLAYQIARQNFVEGGNNRVILATDGDFNVGASSDAEMVRLIEKERESGVFLTVLGFGMGNYKDNKMQQLADKGNGNHAYIDDLSEARKVLVNEFGGTLYTIAKDVKLQIEFNPAQVAGYRLIGYENRLLNDEDFDDDAKDAGELGAGHTVTALYEIIPAGVESEFLADAGALKYQQSQLKASAGDDWCTIKLRYKPADGNTSKLMEQVVTKKTDAASLSNNFNWSAAVAEWGMLLRNSEFKGHADTAHCRQLAEKAKGADRNGYRAEMIALMAKTGAMLDKMTAEK